MTIPLHSYMNLFRRYLKNEWRLFVLLLVSTFLALLFRLLAPQWLGRYVNQIDMPSALSLLHSTALVYALLQLLQRGINIASRYVSEVIGQRATDALRGDIVRHALSLDMSYHKEHTPGEMISRLDHDVNGLSDFFAKFWSGILVGLLSLLGTLLVLLVQAPLLGVLLSLSTAMALVCIFKVKDATVPFRTAELSKIAAHYGQTEEHFAAAEDLRANGAVPHILARFSATLAAWRPLYIKSYLGHSALWSTTQLFFALNSALSFAVCYYLWQQGQADVGTVFMLINYSEQVRLPLSQLHQRFTELQRADAALKRIGETMRLSSQLLDEGTRSLQDDPLELRFEQVCFGYEEDQVVLDDLSFRLQPGQTLGLLGRTGSGKSTLVRLLVRLYDPQQGDIYLGQQRLQEYPLHELRQRIAFVSQEVQLFRASIRDNLSFFDPSISDEQIHAALEHLGLGEWLAQLPQGLDSQLGDDLGLSAGESQLLALTRAFLRQPLLVVLDEASSRLDPLTERRLNQAVEKLLNERSGIIIAHRLSTLEKVDRILILEQGRMLEEGDYAALRDDPQSHFAQLLRVGNMEVMK